MKETGNLSSCLGVLRNAELPTVDPAARMAAGDDPNEVEAPSELPDGTPAQ